MKKLQFFKNLFLLLLFFVLIAMPDISESKSKNEFKSYVPGEIIVKYKQHVSEKAKLYKSANMGAAKVKNIPLIGAELVKIKGDQDLDEALIRYQRDPDVEYAEPNYIRYAKSITPSDPDFSQQWGLYNTGQWVNGVSGTLDADIDIPDAWDVCTGSDQVIVAVLDTGVDYYHPDLNANVWRNAGETICTDGIDNDSNGYMDDCYGWDFAGDDNSPMDMDSHGTHVAGIIGATGNSIGITGVMRTTRIMPLRFFNDNGEGKVTDEVDGISYAIANGAKIINMSFGYVNYSQTEYNAILSAKNAGVLVVAAAENEKVNMDTYAQYPCNYALPNIISVTATDQNDNIATWAAFGPVNVDVGAPGENIYSTVPLTTPTVIFSDNFDDGDISDWAVGGTKDSWGLTSENNNSPYYSLADSPGADYQNNTNSYVITPVINLSGKENCKLEYFIDYDLETNYDKLYTEVSNDLITWNILTGSWTGTESFGSATEDISAYDGQPQLFIRFRLSSGNNVTRDGVYIDDVQIVCTSSNYSYSYEYKNGASMATPYVSGLAGLILAKNPSLTYDQIKSIIINSVDSVLPGLVFSGGRINTYKALSSLCTTEVCDGKDNDCDGAVDEDLTRQTTCGSGECVSAGTETCSNGLWGNSICTPGQPQTEGSYGNATCSDGMDNDCDGLKDTKDSNCAPPDLIVTSVAFAPAKVVRGGSITVTNTIKNQGKGLAGESATNYYLSKDNIKSKKDTLIIYNSVQALAASASAPGTTPITIPDNTRTGSYYIIACADDNKQVAESKEKNNCRASKKMIKVKK